MNLTIDSYRRRDYRSKCQRCGRWMRFHPTTRSPALRRPAPNAGHCTDCPTKRDHSEVRA